MTPRRITVWVAAVALTTAMGTYLYWQGAQSDKLMGKDFSTMASDPQRGLKESSATAADALTPNKIITQSRKPNPGTMNASIGDGPDTDPIVKQSEVLTKGLTELGADLRSPQANNNGAEPNNRPRGWKVTGVQAASCIINQTSTMFKVVQQAHYYKQLIVI